MKPLPLLVLVTFVFVAGCAEATPTANPEWVDQLIQQYEGELVGNPPQSIWRYRYNDQIVYYVPAQCCDMFSALCDADGNVLCAPDGGIDGEGDRRCADFLSQKVDETLIWQDPRKR
jgi:hypothetical protein